MKKFNLYNYLILSCFLFIFSCKKDILSLSYFRSNFYEFKEKPIHLGDKLNIEFGAHQKEIDSVVLNLNGKRFENNSTVDSTRATLGLNRLEIRLYSNNDYIYGETYLPVLNSSKELPIEFEVLKTYPHPQDIFTEGFYFKNGKIYESSGNYKKSFLSSYTLGSDNFLQKEKIDDKIFAEGISEMNGKIYLLTYRERKILVYDAATFQLSETLPMPDELREGWGMTTHKGNFIVSDGTQNIFFYDEKFNLKRKIQVAGYVSVYTNLNELEFVNGKIYANVWQTNYILEINPETGAVERYFDLASLNKQSEKEDVLNGIAYKDGNFLVTGKYWDTIYELSVKP